MIKDTQIANIHPERTNAPRVAEIAILMSGDAADDCDIVLEGTL